MIYGNIHPMRWRDGGLDCLQLADSLSVSISLQHTTFMCAAENDCHVLYLCTCYTVSLPSLCVAIIALNSAVFVLWRIPRLIPLMEKYFISSTTQRTYCTMYIHCIWVYVCNSIIFLPYRLNSPSPSLFLQSYRVVAFWSQYDGTMELCTCSS